MEAVQKALAALGASHLCPRRTWRQFLRSSVSRWREYDSGPADGKRVEPSCLWACSQGASCKTDRERERSRRVGFQGRVARGERNRARVRWAWKCSHAVTDREDRLDTARGNGGTGGCLRGRLGDRMGDQGDGETEGRGGSVPKAGQLSLGLCRNAVPRSTGTHDMCTSIPESGQITNSRRLFTGSTGARVIKNFIHYIGCRTTLSFSGRSDISGSAWQPRGFIRRGPRGVARGCHVIARSVRHESAASPRSRLQDSYTPNDHKKVILFIKNKNNPFNHHQDNHLV